MISGAHRMRASQGFRDAAQFVAGRLQQYGLDEVEILQFPADGKRCSGPRSRAPPGTWTRRSSGNSVGRTTASGPGQRAWRTGRPCRSRWHRTATAATSRPRSSTSAAAPRAADYAGKDVRGKLVLVSAQPEDVQALAVERHGAAGIVSYAQNQRTAWFGEDANLLRWGHLDSFAATPTFAFMVSPKQARAWQQPAGGG